MAAPLNNDDLLQILLEYDSSDDDFDYILLDTIMPEEREQTYNPAGPRFDLDNLSNTQCRAFFRFNKADIYSLCTALRIPDRFVCPNRTVVEGIDAMCIFLRRLAYPSRLLDLEPLFRRPKSTLSLIFTEVLNFIYENHNHRLQDLAQPIFRNRLQIYADSIYAKGAPLKNCFGFIDGTVRPLCRPTHHQKVCYNGHKRIHAIKFQSIVTPDGMIMNMFGPVEGRRHDCTLLRMSGIVDQLQNAGLVDRNGMPYSLYGDPAYPVRDCLLAPYRAGHLTVEEELFNKCMSSVRQCVEWQFGKLLTQFSFLDFRKNLKVLLQPVAKIYLVGALLTNCHSCIYGSQTSQYFQLNPPTLEEYLQ